MLVIGAARGLGAACAERASQVGWDVLRADAVLPGADHLDLTRPQSIVNFCARLALRRIDALLLVAGVCDAAAVSVPGSSLPRVAWVNCLGHVVVLNELEKRGIAVGRVVLVGSGSYARGTMLPHFFPPSWSVLGAMAAYSQSKFAVTAWASWLQQGARPPPAPAATPSRSPRGRRPPSRPPRRRDVVIINPGPMRSTIGDAHVPFLLWPTYGLMKEVLFPLPSVAAEAVLHFAADAAPPAYVHIRQPGVLTADVTSPACHAWLLPHVRRALRETGYAWDSTAATP